MDLITLFPVFIIIAMCMVIIFTELVKKLDKKNKLKGYRVYIPFVFSFLASYLLLIGGFFVSKQFLFWWMAVFGFSVFAYEAILQKIKKTFSDETNNSNNNK